jgi:hypothetical protein
MYSNLKRRYTMKTKKLNKKLFLNKETIADLGNSGMNDVYGGVGTTGDTYTGTFVWVFCSKICTRNACGSVPDTDCTNC